MDFSNEELNSLPALNDGSVRRECKYQTPTVNNNTQSSARTKLIIATVLCFVFFLAEVIGGLLANSLAILADSAHMFSDLSSFFISIIAIYLSSRPNSKSMTYGWHRAEIIGALFSVILIWLVTGILVYTAILRILNNNYQIDANIMLIMAGAGVITNVILAFVLHSHGHSHKASHDKMDNINGSSEHLLHGHSDSHDPLTMPNTKKTRQHENINLRAAFIHVIGDVIQSFGVLAAAFVIFFKPEWKIADPISTFLFSFLVILTTVFIFRDIICVLLEHKPRHINYNNLETYISSIPGVKNIHNLRLWSITLSRTAMSCHMVVDPSSNGQEILEKAYYMCIEDFNFTDVTIQLESSSAIMNHIICD